jgi:predicted DNA repair protein MutK
MKNLAKLAVFTTAVLVIAIFALFFNQTKFTYMLFGIAVMAEVAVLVTTAVLGAFSLLVNRKQTT